MIKFSKYFFQFLFPFLICLTVPTALVVADDVELVANGDFNSGLDSWWNSGSEATINSGVLEVSVPENAVNPWEAIVGQSNINIATGSVHTLSFDAWADTPVTIIARIQLNEAPYTTYFSAAVELTTNRQTFSFTFEPSVDDPAAAFQFQLGGNGAFTASLDDVSLLRSENIQIPTTIGELIQNGLFDSGEVEPWWMSSSILASVGSGRLEAIINSSDALSEAVLGQSGFPIYAGVDYVLTLKAWASSPVTADLSLEGGGASSEHFSTSLALTQTPKTFTLAFSASTTDLAAELLIQFADHGEFMFYLDNVSLIGPVSPAQMPRTELLSNGFFSEGLSPWWVSGDSSEDVSAERLVVTVHDGGVNPWDTIVGQNNVSLVSGGEYNLSFEASASSELNVTLLLQLNGAPYTQYFNVPLSLTTETQSYNFSFSSAFDDEAAQFQFQIGGQGAFEFTVDNVSLIGPKPEPIKEYLTIVRVNQHGYRKQAPKRATLAVEVEEPLAWTLYDADNTAVLTGLSTPFGWNSASAEFVHHVDFSDYETPGNAYSLEVYGERSHPFDITDDVYKSLKRDALKYFYHNRSGIEISEPFVGGAEWTRPAGHLNVSPNQGDVAVPCFDLIDLEGTQWTGCDYELDVSKGWYDAGDHGKYVVNGGITVWTLLNQYERSKGRSSIATDDALNIPESGNGIPDILDEVRWQLEFMLSMQVLEGGLVEGEDLTGMVHHKLHDRNWTGNIAPHEDPQARFLYPPSTAATLNLAAVAAQAARIWRDIDPAFAQRCLDAAEIAFTAAKAHPDHFARGNFTGGGAYGDTNVNDEFYWAAAELFISTHQYKYLKFIKQSEYFLRIPGEEQEGLIMGSAMNWSQTEALGTISLAVATHRGFGHRDALHSKALNSKAPSLNALHWTETEWNTFGRKALGWNILGWIARKDIIRVADGYIAALNSEGYELPHSSDSYYWGSNSAVLSNMMILGLAYDFTHQQKYLEAISQGMDYLLGRNPVVKSYVSGYGENAMLNPHHRFWSHQVNPDFPPPPPGALAGGPNGFLQDPHVQSVFPNGCALQTCYVDHIDSYSTNEVAINWNAPLAWVSAFLDEARFRGNCRSRHCHYRPRDPQRH